MKDSDNDTTAPERIWLQVDPEAVSDCDEPFPSDHDGITWSAESIGGQEVEYVRADLADTHHNNLTPAEAERLALLMEELGEVQQAIGKIFRHGYESRHPSDGPTNREALERELGDVDHCIRRLCGAGDINGNSILLRADEKAKSIALYLHHNR